MWLLIAVWSALIGASLAWNVDRVRQQTRELAEREARTNFAKDLAFRLWSTRHGGVYVPMNERTPPNPYLAHLPNRDVGTDDGQRLTLMNPAYMLSQMMGEFEELYGIKGDITSLKPLNPANAPDPWQREALLAFDRGETEVSEVSDYRGQPYLRLMRPMLTREGCLKCHAHQGYKVGDIRGGIGVSVPLRPYLGIQHDSLRNLFVSHSALWLPGLAGTLQMTRRDLKAALEEQRLNDRLTTNEERWVKALDGAGHGVWDWNAGTGRVYYSHQWKTMLGCADSEVGESLDEWEKRVHPDDLDACCRDLKAHFAGATPFYRNTHRVLHKGGGYLWILDQGMVWERDTDGSPRRMVGTHTDVTHQKQIEEALEQARNQAEAASRAKGEFLANVSHELRTPLNSLLILARSLERDNSENLTPDQLEAVQVIGGSGRRLLALINDLLDLSRLEANAEPLEPAPVYLSSLVQEMQRRFRPQTRDKELELVTEMAPGLPASILSDPGKLDQILTNLLGNAIKFTDQGKVLLQLFPAPPQLSPECPAIAMRVRDTGIGIARHQQQMVFDAFHQLGNPERRRQGGTGLGLSIARAHARALGGDILLDSRPGEGSSFTLVLPTTPDATRTPARTPSPEPVAGGEAEPGKTAVTVLHSTAVPAVEDQRLSGRTVLVLDGDMRNALSLAKTLRSRGLRVMPAASIEHALTLLQTTPEVAAVLMDRGVTGANGSSALGLLRQAPVRQRLPIIVMADALSPADRDDCLSAGADDCLDKSLGPDRLCDQIALHLNADGPGASSAGTRGPAPAERDST
jgi:chemotaxis family two-component system sensor kinase Cph1